MPPRFSSTKLSFSFTLCVWLLLIVFQLCKVYNTPLWLDDAVFAQAAKNLVLGNGYAIAGFEGLGVFATGISSGPVVILPAALMIKLFGNTYWAPGLTCVILINVLLIAAFFQLRKLLPTATLRWQCAGLFLLTSLLVTNHNAYLSEQMQVWHALMGEIPSALCIIMATLYIAGNRSTPKTLFIGGLIAGLGALCKIQVVISIGILGVCLSAYYLLTRKENNLTYRHVVACLILYGVGALLPLALFESVKIIHAGWTPYLSNVALFTKALRDVDALSNGATMYEKIVLLGQYIGIIHAPLHGFLMYVAFLITMAVVLLRSFYVCIKHLLKRSSPPVFWAANTLFLCCVVQLLWWLIMCQWLMPRYALQPLMYGCAALALAATHSRSRLLIIIAVVIMIFRYDAALYLWEGIGEKKHYHEQQEVLDTLLAIKQKAPDTVIFSCGYTFEMEYLLPQSANFVACEQLEDPAFAKKPKILLSFTVNEAGQLLYFRKDSILATNRYNLPIALKHCPANDIYAGKRYFIASCNTE